jgi:aldose 1-epimerase
MWNAFPNQSDGSVVFSYLSPDGDEGYPGGNLEQHFIIKTVYTNTLFLDVVYNVKYSLGSAGDLKLDFKAMVTAATPVNLVNHVYFNLAGHKAGAEGTSWLAY